MEQALDTFSDLVTATIDFAQARSNEFMPAQPGQQTISPMLDIAKLQKIQFAVGRIKRAAGFATK